MDALPYSGCHGDEGTIDLEPFLEGALEEVVETIMLFGEYPQPPTKVLVGHRPHRQFDLYEFISENEIIDRVEMDEFFVLAMIDYERLGPFEDQRDRYRKRIETMLTKHLEGSEIVREKAEQLAQEA